MINSSMINRIKGGLLSLLVVTVIMTVLAPFCLRAADLGGSGNSDVGSVMPAAQAQITTLPNPLGEAVTPYELAGRVIKVLLGLSGAAALVIFIYGGVQFMISGGNSTKIQSAKNTLVYSALGLAIIFGSYALLQFVLQAISGSLGSS